MLDPDSGTETMDDQYSEDKVMGTMVVEGREADIMAIDFKDILMKEPGLLNLTVYQVDLGDHLLSIRSRTICHICFYTVSTRKYSK